MAKIRRSVYLKTERKEKKNHEHNPKSDREIEEDEKVRYKYTKPIDGKKNKENGNNGGGGGG